jgi:sugar phosphate isomerase/epimerase
MATLSMNEATTFRWSFEEDVSRYAAAGIPAIGVWRQKLSDCGQCRGAELVRQNGLAVSHLFWAGGFTGYDGRSYRDSVEDAADGLRTAAALGAGCLIVYSGARGGHTTSHARRLLHSALGELLPLAQSLDVTIALEPMHPGCAADWTFLTSLDDALTVLDAFASPYLKLVLDTYHLLQTPEVLARLPQIVDRIALVQLGDARHPPEGEQNRCRLGEGLVPLREVVCALRTAGYDGFYDVELLGEEFEAADYRELLRHARDAYASLLE